MLPILCQLILPLKQPWLRPLLLPILPQLQLAHHQTLLLPQLPGQQAKLLMLLLLLILGLAGCHLILHKSR